MFNWELKKRLCRSDVKDIEYMLNWWHQRQLVPEAYSDAITDEASYWDLQFECDGISPMPSSKCNIFIKKETVVKLVLRIYGALPKNSYSGSLPDNPCCWRNRWHAFICLVSDIMFQFPTLEDLHLAKYIFSHNSYWLLTQEGEVVPRSAVQRTSAAAAFIKPLPQTDRLHIQNIPQLPNMFWL